MTIISKLAAALSHSEEEVVAELRKVLGGVETAGIDAEKVVADIMTAAEAKLNAMGEGIMTELKEIFERAGDLNAKTEELHARVAALETAAATPQTPAAPGTAESVSIASTAISDLSVTAITGLSTTQIEALSTTQATALSS